MSIQSKKLDELSINTIRFLAVDGVQKANSGHPGMPMGCAPIAYELYGKYMKYNPANPKWVNRDRFVLSAGHGSMLLYSMLHLTGFDLPLEELQSFRQWESKTPGHPEFGLTPGVETTTGPLGQGITNAIGMAIAQEYLAAVFNKDDIKLIDHYIYVIASDGDLMEGISHEAASLAGHLKLGKLIIFYDNNGITIDGETHLSFSEDVAKRFDAYGWHVLRITDVNDLEQIEKAVEAAQKETTKPTIVVTTTHIGYGSPNKQDKESSHGSPLGVEEVKLTKQNLGWPDDKFFYIPDEVKEFFSQFKEKGKCNEEEWNKLFESYSAKYPKEADLFKSVTSGNYGDEWIKALPIKRDEGKKVATRSASGNVINAIAPHLLTLIGGSADLAPSNNTMIKGIPAFSAANRAGRNFHFGIREHGMAGMLNGMAVYGGVIPYGATFLVFSDYLRPSLRLASLSGVRPILIFTHDSIGLGEDGPTHQPVEHIASLRAIPGLIVIRPADTNETAYAWKVAIETRDRPVALILTRQELPVLDPSKYNTADLEKGGYILKDSDGTPDLIIIATGSEVYISLEAAEKLEAEGLKVRVVSLPSWELFDKQSGEYKESVLPSNVKARISVEAGVKMGWHQFVGDYGDSISLDRFGASAPLKVVMGKFGFTADNIVNRSKEVLAKVRNK